MLSFAQTQDARAIEWKERLKRSGYFLAALLLHIVLFLMVATWIIFQAPPPPPVTFFTASTKVMPPAPPPPPPTGGEAFKATTVPAAAPPPSVTSVVTLSQASLFNVHSVKVDIPHLPASTTMTSTGLVVSGTNAAGGSSGPGNPFGQMSTDGNTSQFLGYLYDLKQDRGRRPTGMNLGRYDKTIKSIVLGGSWDLGQLRDFYKSSKPLSASGIFMPTMDAQLAPKAFGLEQEVQPGMWVIWYHVRASPNQDGDYHFVGTADDVLLVAVDHRTVLDGTLWGLTPDQDKQGKIEMSNFSPTCGPNGNFWVGKSFHLRAGEKVDIDVLVGEEPGGSFNAFLYLQREQSTYQKQANGSPLLPIFQLGTQPIVPAGAPPSFPPYAATPEAWTPGG